MNYSVSVTLLLLLGICAALAMAAHVNNNEGEQCRCSRFEKDSMTKANIYQIEIFTATENCEYTEIKAHLMSPPKTAVCLSGKTPWVKTLITDLLNETEK